MLHSFKNSLYTRAISSLVIFTFTTSLVTLPLPKAQAQSVISMPLPGLMVMQSPAFTPVLLRGLKIDPKQPFHFDFIVDSGDSLLKDKKFEDESKKLIKYFLASLTIPEDDLWVNLSPYEKDRIISEEFGQTEMGRDLLTQDYLLKQFTASLMYPEEELGEKFWNKVYEKAYQKFGTTNIPINTFNKVWIVPDKAVIYEKGQAAFITESHLKVMLEEDYLALRENLGKEKFGTDQISQAGAEQISTITSQVVKEILIPEIEKEVNEGSHFIQLRQIYHSLILATWYKETIKESLINQIYTDKKDIKTGKIPPKINNPSPKATVTLINGTTNKLAIIVTGVIILK